MGGRQRWGRWIPLAMVVAACTAGPAASTSPSSATLGIGCTLPVYRWGGVTNGGNCSIIGQYGFLDVASGKFEANTIAFSTGYYD
jgi:hypothetical protein